MTLRIYAFTPRTRAFRILLRFLHTMDSSINTKAVNAADEDLKTLRQELKQWETSFFACHKRKAERQDIKQHPEIGNHISARKLRKIKLTRAKSRNTRHTMISAIQFCNQHVPRYVHPPKSANTLRPRMSIPQ